MSLVWTSFGGLMTPAPLRTISNPSQEEQSHLVSRRSHTESPKQLFFFSKSNLCICKRCCCSASLQGHWQQCQGILITCKSFLIIHSLFLAPSSYSLIAKSVSSFIRLRSLRGEARQAWTDCSDCSNPNRISVTMFAAAGSLCFYMVKPNRPAQIRIFMLYYYSL